MKKVLFASILSIASFVCSHAMAAGKYPIRAVEGFADLIMIDDASAQEIFDLAKAKPSTNQQAIELQMKIVAAFAKLGQSDFCKAAAEFYQTSLRESERPYEADERKHSIQKMETACRMVLTRSDFATGIAGRALETQDGSAPSASSVQTLVSGMVAMMVLMPH